MTGREEPYLDLFRDYHEAFGGGGFVADYFTSSDTGAVARVGVTGVKTGVFVVDTAGPPRIMVGPVADAYSSTGASGVRSTDEGARHVDDASRVRPWSASYTVPTSPEPPLLVRVVGVGARREGRLPRVTVELRNSRALGPVTIELLDHHRRPVASVTRNVGASATRVSLGQVRAPEDTTDYEGLRVKVGDWGRVATGVADRTEGEDVFSVYPKMALAFGGMRPPGDAAAAARAVERARREPHP